jgi:hypothetical protein
MTHYTEIDFRVNRAMKVSFLHETLSTFASVHEKIE